MISLVIHNATSGTNEVIRRKNNPRETTNGPESQTIFRTGGTLRSGEGRSFQPLQKDSCWAIFLCAYIRKSEDLTGAKQPSGVSVGRIVKTSYSFSWDINENLFHVNGRFVKRMTEGLKSQKSEGG